MYSLRQRAFAPIITGSLAFDYLLRVQGAFGDGWGAAGEGGFSAAYFAPRLDRVFGGCAGNIAYALHCLGDSPRMVATVGRDFAPYAAYWRELGVDTAHLLQLDDCYTAQAFIATDEAENQFIAFHPGATAFAQRQNIGEHFEGAPPALSIVSPNDKEGMMQHCRDLHAAGAAFLFDPGQAIGMYSGEELLECMTLAPHAIFNESELQTALQKTGLTRAALADKLQTLFVTHGASGSEAWQGGEHVKVDSVRLGDTADPTGCGDAYRAGLMFALMRGAALVQAMRLAATVAAFKAVHKGGQGYELTLDGALAACGDAFGAAPAL